MYIAHYYNSLTITTFNYYENFVEEVKQQFHLLTHSYYHRIPPHEACFWLRDCHILITCIGP